MKKNPIPPDIGRIEPRYLREAGISFGIPFESAKPYSLHSRKVRKQFLCKMEIPT